MQRITSISREGVQIEFAFDIWKGRERQEPFLFE